MQRCSITPRTCVRTQHVCHSSTSAKLGPVNAGLNGEALPYRPRRYVSIPDKLRIDTNFLVKLIVGICFVGIMTVSLAIELFF